MPVIARYGTGGGNMPIIVQRRFSNVIVTDTDVAPTLEAGGGGGGNNLPMILEPYVVETDTTIKIGGASVSRLGGQDKCQ